MKKHLFAFLVACVAAAAPGRAQDLALRGGTVLTISHGVIENGTILIQGGKITACGRDVPIPSGVEVIDVTGMYIMPGIIDSHSHIGFDMEDVNEATDPVTPQVWMKDALDPLADSILKTLAGGVTTVKTMHGSANVIGGVNVTIKLKYGNPVEEMIVPVRQQLKLALGENPKRFYGGKGVLPSTRMGSAFILRKAFTEAREYIERWERYEKQRAAGNTKVMVPKKDLAMETLRMVLEKKLTADCHAYRADEIVWIIHFCQEFGIDLRQISHCVDGYKVADIMARSGVSFGGWVDWWGFKEEAYDGCPFGFKIMHDAGVNIVINSDSADEGRYLFRNAAKVLKYNDLEEVDVLKMITLNAAKSLEMEARAGTIDIGKDGDLAVFDKHPLDSTSKCRLTIIEGKVYFDYARDNAAAQGGAHE